MSLQTEPECHLRDSSGGWGSFSIQSWIRNYVVHIDITPLKKKEIMTICFAFLISVLEVSIGMSTMSKKKKKITLTFNNSQMTTNPASKNFFCKRWILFHSDFFRWFWHEAFPRGYLTPYPSCRLMKVKLDSITFQDEEVQAFSLRHGQREVRTTYWNYTLTWKEPPGADLIAWAVYCQK